MLQTRSKGTTMRPATPEETVLISSCETALPQASEHARGPIFPQRLPHLGLVLWVSLSMPIAGSAYYLFGGTAPTVQMQQDYRLVGGVITQVTSLTALWYVMCRKGRGWKDIGWKLEFADIPRATGLLIAAVVTMYLPVIPIQYFYRAYSGHFHGTELSTLDIRIWNFFSIDCVHLFESVLRRANRSRLHHVRSHESWWKS
jgi:hypothetical protein